MNINGDNTPNNPLPPTRWDHRSTSGILKSTAVIFFSLFPSFFFLSLLLFSFRTLLENGTVYVTSFIDRDPSVKSLLSRVDIAANNQNINNPSSDSLSPSSVRHRRHRPFLHLTRVGTLDDDFFSGDDDDDHRSLFFNSRNSYSNYTFVTLQDFNPVFRVSKIELEENLNKKNGYNSTSNLRQDDIQEEERENIVDLRFFVAGLELGRRDAAALLVIVSVLSAAYGWIILGFVITYSWAFGIVFISVVNDLLGRYISFIDSVLNGSKLGVKKLSGFILMRWAVRDALTQILGLWFFGEIHDQYSFFKLFLRLKLMPFSVSSPWVPGYDREVSGFLFAWYLMDTIVSFVFAVDSWVTIANTRRGGGRDIIKEGCYLLATMIHQSIQLKCLELILCGAFMRWVIAGLFGRSFAVLLQALVEVYFMVAWLIYYFSARSKDANFNGRTFGNSDIEGLIEGLR
ncbi:uncharacterized protein LOC130813172 [Amaranthus tricolor]|uniref:uncharacterized protein LOC130813172 n=1 Tax=Amaranthus tricolor TaxID=29722 RepID=UPI00258626DA|nr:uncharacterized protein LOC130813172 [Amaranthus tricolor]